MSLLPLRSFLFSILFYVWNGFLCIVCVGVLLLPAQQYNHFTSWYVKTISWLEQTILGLHYVVRGLHNIPNKPCIIAAKHQSAWETFKLPLLLQNPAIVLKQELLRIPLWGKYLQKFAPIPINRQGGVKALQQLVQAVQKCTAQGRKVVIFPEGTRTLPGKSSQYHSGLAFLYQKLHLPIVPMALNSGVFWPKGMWNKRPGTIVVEFLPSIPPGLSKHDMMATLQNKLEHTSNILLTEALNQQNIDTQQLHKEE